MTRIVRPSTLPRQFQYCVRPFLNDDCGMGTAPVIGAWKPMTISSLLTPVESPCGDTPPPLGPCPPVCSCPVPVAVPPVVPPVPVAVAVPGPTEPVPPVTEPPPPDVTVVPPVVPPAAEPGMI